MTAEKCYRCGADYGLHHFSTDACPRNGIEETRDGHKQEWEEGSTFLAVSDGKLNASAPQLLQALKAIASENYDDDDKRRHLIAIIDRMKNRANVAIKAVES